MGTKVLKKLILSLLFLSSLYGANIKLAVAANVSYAMDELKKEFKKLHPDIKVRVTLGSSGKLTAQIKNGAPYDLFMSANMKYPESLYKNNLAITKPLVYARGSLALLSNNQRSFKKGINLTKSMLVKRIAIANPKTAPYGIAAEEAFKKAGILKDIEDKLIFAESISQTVSYTLMAADVGFVAKSSLYSKKMRRFKENVHWVEVDKTLYTPIDQGMVILKKAKENKDVKKFYDFMLSDKAKNILKRYGYITQ
jgi:molybdate transport system substrate-binding protein